MHPKKANMATMSAADDGSTHPREELRSKPIKKICLILISFIPAIVLLSITNVIVAHIFVASTILFPKKAASASSSSSSPTKTEPKALKKKKVTKVETKTVYVSPTQEDLDRIREELETSDPLPPITTGDKDNHGRSAARIQSGITSMDSLLKQHEEGLKMASKEIGELSEVFDAFVERLEQETSRGVDDVAAKQLEVQLASLKALLGRTSFMDLDRQSLMQMFMLAMEELQWLLNAEESSADPLRTALIRNVNNTLLATIVNEAYAEGDETISERSQQKAIWLACQSSYLALDQGKPANEFVPPKKAVAKSPKEKNAAKSTAPVPPTITEETARESDLYELVESIKQTLSRRDLTSAKLDENDESLPSPISDEGVEGIRSNISPMVNTIEKKWETVLAQESQMREYWMGRTEDLKAGAFPSDDNVLCASPKLVQDMMRDGLEALHSKGGIKDSLRSTGIFYFDSDEAMEDILLDEMERINLPEIDYTGDDGGKSPQSPGTSSWKLGKQSISYAVDGPLLHRGVVGWIDYFVDAISGYNDHVDALLDYIVGDEGESVGTATAGTISKIVRKIPFPVEYVGRLKKSGILAGRTRGILEE